MKPVLATVTVITSTGLAAVGGGIAVFGAYDDSPGGTLLGILLVLGTLAFGVRTAWRSQ